MASSSSSTSTRFDYERRASLKEMPSFRSEASTALGRMDSISEIKARLEANREILRAGMEHGNLEQTRPWLRVGTGSAAAPTKRTSVTDGHDHPHLGGHRRVSAHEVDRHGVAAGLPVVDYHGGLTSSRVRDRNLSRGTSASGDSSGSHEAIIAESSFEYDN